MMTMASDKPYLRDLQTTWAQALQVQLLPRRRFFFLISLSSRVLFLLCHGPRTCDVYQVGMHVQVWSVLSRTMLPYF